MANSKSNIYPIQLQGAELCLNRYDAEIKQYRGFNKNNSPFVGGCLSNIFTKDETIEGANKNSIYIDNNSNIYSIEDGLRLKKNGDTLIEFDSNKLLFWKNEEIKVDSDIVKVFTENIYLKKIVVGTNYNFVVQRGDTYDPSHVLLSVPITESARGVLDDRLNNNVTGVVVTIGDKLYFCGAGMKSSGTAVILIDCDTLEVEYFANMYGNDGDIDSNGLISICFNNNEFYIFAERRGFISFRVFPISDGWRWNICHSTISSSTAGTGELLISSNIKDYHVCGYPFNTLIPRYSKGLDSSYYQSDVKPIIKLSNMTYNTASPGTFEFGSKVILNNGIRKIGVYLLTIENYSVRQDLIYDLGTHTPLLGVFDYQVSCVQYKNNAIVDKNSICFHCTPTPDERVVSGFSFYTDDSLTNLEGVKNKIAKYVLGDRIQLGDLFYLEFNNNQFSAICGENVLLTEWNAVDASTLCFYSDRRESSKINGLVDERLVYKVGDKWYVIKNGEPEIKAFGNQLVVNIDSQANSYDFRREMVLHFATSYNSLYIRDRWNDYGIYCTLIGETDEVFDNVRVAAAVNEYAQENNSSIILNPVTLYDADIDFDAKGITNAFRTRFNDIVNVYYDPLSTAQAIYRYSLNAIISTRENAQTSKIFTDLRGLPFPIDANGNVEYNVNLFSTINSIYGNNAFVTSGLNSYPLVIGNNNEFIMSYYLASGIEGLEEMFIIQGQFYGIINKNLFSMYYQNSVIAGVQFIVSVENLQFCGNTPYEALFFSKTNRCLYSFTGANVLNQKQLVDKISIVKTYKYNPATQSIFLLTDIGVIVSSLFGIYMIDMPEAENMFLLNNGVILCDDEGHYRYIRYYKEDTDADYIKQNIKLETSFYGMNNEVVTINDCLYFRIFSEEHEEGNLKVSATTISLRGRKTEETTFKIKASDWDKITHTIYLRYQPKTQRGLGVAFAIDSPFKIASLSVGSQPDAVLVDKVSKGAITAPSVTTNNNEW